MIKKLIQSTANASGYEIRKIQPPPKLPDIPDAHLYQPLFSPWLAGGEFKKYHDLAASRTLVTPDRCHVLYTLVRQAANVPGDVWECGVYKGGTAGMFAAILNQYARDKKLHLFDTFEGMPETDASKDWHKSGDFSDTSLETVSKHVGFGGICVYHKGFIPDTFRGLENSKIAFAHIDVDIYKSILDCLAFMWPRMAAGGFVVFDDYGFPSCPGARLAVDEFFAGKKCFPLCLPTGQAVVFNHQP